jgi:hypothetical protein
MSREIHLADAELVQSMDGELDGSRAVEVERHLRACQECRERRAVLERAMGAYMAVRRGRRQWRWAAAVAAAGLVGLFVWSGVRKGPLPDGRLTPGVVREVTREQVCLVAPEDEGRSVPAELAGRVFARYGIVNPKPREYEVDYLISPALGGTTVVENLWPLPYADGVWTSRVKDALEEHLRNEVCAGRIGVGAAQREIAGNWIGAYQKHFRTKVPVAEHAGFVKDSPWE